jgi:hypothetical protein
MRRRRLGWFAIGVLLCAACDNGGAHSGTLAVNLVTAGANDGAIVLTISGGPVTAVHPPGGFQVASHANATGTHLMVTGAITAGTVALIDVPDLSRASAYAVTVDQVADRTSFALLDPAPYRATVVPR